jgi:hypothetical protein
MEGQVLFDILDVGVGDEGGPAQPAFPLAVLALKQVACSLTPTEDLARTSDFEAFGDGFPCLCFSRDSWHGAGRLGFTHPMARQKWSVFLRNSIIQVTSRQLPSKSGTIHAPIRSFGASWMNFL